MTKRSRQISILAKEKSAYGGDLMKTRAGRMRGRPLSTRLTMHIVLRSTKAHGAWSFKNPKNERNLTRIVGKFASAYGVRVLSMANVGNHLHFQVKLSNRFTYKPFIRAITGAIAMAVTGRTRWSQSTSKRTGRTGEKTDRFWDYRPFTRIIESFKAYLNLKDYVRINQLEGDGYRRDDARFMLKIEKRLAQESG